jgi:hypothetical protein
MEDAGCGAVEGPCVARDALLTLAALCPEPAAPTGTLGALDLRMDTMHPLAADDDLRRAAGGGLAVDAAACAASSLAFRADAGRL